MKIGRRYCSRRSCVGYKSVSHYDHAILIITDIGGKMERHQVIVFKPYPFKIGQKIYIDNGHRKGDWEVIGLSDRKVKLRCPVSFREFDWDSFCYFVEEAADRIWPNKE